MSAGCDAQLLHPKPECSFCQPQDSVGSDKCLCVSLSLSICLSESPRHGQELGERVAGSKLSSRVGPSVGGVQVSAWRGSRVDHEAATRQGTF